MTYLPKSVGDDAHMTSDMPAAADPWADIPLNEYNYNPVAAAYDAAQTVIGNLAAAITAVPASSAPAVDGNLNVSASGSASISVADFYPGTCKPMNFVALGYVQSLQGQLNRVAMMKGWGKIGVDGQIGPASLALLKKVQAAYPAVMGDSSSCLNTSADADVIADQVKQVADTLRAPATVPPASSKAATIMTKSGVTVLPPGAAPASILGAFSGVTIGQAVALGAMGVLGYKIFGKKKRK